MTGLNGVRDVRKLREPYPRAKVGRAFRRTREVVVERATRAVAIQTTRSNGRHGCQTVSCIDRHELDGNLPVGTLKNTRYQRFGGPECRNSDALASRIAGEWFALGCWKDVKQIAVEQKRLGSRLACSFLNNTGPGDQTEPRRTPPKWKPTQA